jgi:hypothetical protein
MFSGSKLKTIIFMSVFSKAQVFIIFINKYVYLLRNFFSIFIILFGILKANLVKTAHCADSENQEPGSFSFPFSALEPTLPHHHLNVAIGSGLGLIIISLICMLWIRLSYSFPDLKNTKPYLLNKYSLVRKLNDYYESFTPEQLKALRIIFILTSLYCNFTSFMIFWKLWSILKIFYFK